MLPAGGGRGVRPGLTRRRVLTSKVVGRSVAPVGEAPAVMAAAASADVALAVVASSARRRVLRLSKTAADVCVPFVVDGVLGAAAGGVEPRRGGGRRHGRGR